MYRNSSFVFDLSMPTLKSRGVVNGKAGKHLLGKQLFYKESNESCSFAVSGQIGLFLAVLKISAILLKYPMYL